jgi:hypothetical protein
MEPGIDVHVPSLLINDILENYFADIYYQVRGYKNIGNHCFKKN